MSNIILLNKPFNVLSKFTEHNSNKETLSKFCDIPNVYPCGRLDYNSEGLLLLTDQGWLQHLISHPKHKLPKTYYVQVEGTIDNNAVSKLQAGIQLKDGLTKPAVVEKIEHPQWLWNRTPPIRERANIPTSWIKLTIREGKNRQVRRMTAAVGFPTLRLIRYSIGPWNINGINNGKYTVKKAPKNKQEAIKIFKKYYS